MLFLKFVSICVLIKSNTAAKNSVPVLIIDQDKALSKIFDIAPNPLIRVSQESFGSVLHGAIKKSDLILIFVEKTFCMEDITKKDRSGTPYQNLKRLTAEKKVKFLPSVVEPFTVLSQMFRAQVYNVYYIADEPPAAMFEMRFKYYYIFFKDSDDGVRANILRRHDIIISKVCSMARKVSKDVIAFYTGKKNPVVFEPMVFVPVKPLKSPESVGITVASSGAMFRFVGVHRHSATRRSAFDQKPLITEELWEKDNKLSTTMSFGDYELQFDFTFTTTEWRLSSVSIVEGEEQVGVTRMDVGAPLSYSYVCSVPLIIINTRDRSQVIISRYQIQPLVEVNTVGDLTKRAIPPIKVTKKPKSHKYLHIKSYKPAGFKFGPGVNCSPYFTSQIMAGLFVTVVCLSILACGVGALFDVLSNDRFDDPASKINFGVIDG